MTTTHLRGAHFLDCFEADVQIPDPKFAAKLKTKQKKNAFCGVRTKSTKKFCTRPRFAIDICPYLLTQGAQNPGMETITRGGSFSRKPIGLEERRETENVSLFLYP